jgi:hypothetical protein
MVSKVNERKMYEVQQATAPLALWFVASALATSIALGANTAGK